jgi:thymidylate synthase
MKAYLDLLRDIKDNGFSRGDRTGIGRRSVIGRQLRFNMNDGFPLVTTRKIYTKAIIAELLWFISGSTDTKVLNNDNVSIWDKWKLEEKHVIDYISNFIKNYYPNINLTNISRLEDLKKPVEQTEDDGVLHLYRYCANSIGSIGKLYGHSWRNLISFTSKSTPLYINPKNKEKIDQLSILIEGLKSNPYSARHIVTTWIPEYLAIEKDSIEQNIINGKGGIAPCHILFQCFVIPSDDPTKKNRLSLQMYQR